jgi:hypothetical protein
MTENVQTTKPDLSALCIEGSARAERISAPIARATTLIALVIVSAAGSAYAYFSRSPKVEVSIARVAERGGYVTLHASGYVTPRRRATRV